MIRSRNCGVALITMPEIVMTVIDLIRIPNIILKRKTTYMLVKLVTLTTKSDKAFRALTIVVLVEKVKPKTDAAEITMSR